MPRRKKIHPKYYNSKTPDKWRKIADAALASLPFVQASLATSPFSDKVTWWLGFGYSFVVVAFKFLTKILAPSEHNTPEIEEELTQTEESTEKDI
jgi:hypothetical protein